MIFPEPEPPQPAITPAMQPRKIKTKSKAIVNSTTWEALRCGHSGVLFFEV